MKIKINISMAASAAILLSFIVVSCKQKAELPEDMVAQVNDSYLREGQLNYVVPDGLDEQTALVFKKSMISKWVETETLYQSALKEGYELSEKENYMVDAYSKSLLVQSYLNQKLNRSFTVSQKRIEDYYSEHGQEFVRSEDEVHIIHLFLAQRDKAIFTEIARSDDLLKIIKKYYFDEKSTPEHPNGDLGYIALSRLPEKMRKATRRLKTGSISRPIRSAYGYHFIQLLDLQKAGSRRGLDEVRDEILLRLQKDSREEERGRLLSDLKENFQIQTYLSKIQD